MRQGFISRYSSGTASVARRRAELAVGAMKTIDEALKHEFRNHWQADEVPPLPNEAALEMLARTSGRRLRSVVDSGQLPALKQFLEDVQSDPNHPFMMQMLGDTSLEWNDTPQSWAMFQRLLEIIKTSLVDPAK